MDDASLVTRDQPGVADDTGGRIRKRKRLTKVIHAVFIKTSLARRIRNRKLRRQPSQWEIREPSESSVEGSVDLSPNSPEAETAEQPLPDSDFKTICLLNERHSGEKKSVKFTACFLPLSLLVLVLWGKVFAIFFTSTLMLGIGTLSKDSESFHGGRSLHLKHYLREPLLDL